VVLLSTYEGHGRYFRLDVFQTHSHLIAAIVVRYPDSACEMVLWSPSQTGGFPGSPVSSHTNSFCHVQSEFGTV